MPPGRWNPDVHPRGHDGEFIETYGLVRLIGVFAKGRDGKPVDLSGRRGQVTEIIPDRSTPGRPNIRVRLLGNDGKPTGPMVNVKPDRLTSAEPVKARFGPSNRDTFFDEPRPRPQPQGELARLRQHQQQEAARVRGLTDEELAKEKATTGPLGQQAISVEQKTRAARALADAKRRQVVIDRVNQAAARLSTTDAEERAKGLDKILSELRFSILSTDQIYDQISPPLEDGGRYTPDRHRQHEEIWEELLAKVEAGNFPRDHDALALGGLPGAGKSSTILPGGPAESFGVKAWEMNLPLEEGATHISLNGDVVKALMIDKGMLPEGINLKPMEQVMFIHEESVYLTKQFMNRLGAMGYNVVLDNMMDSEQGALKRFTPLARQGYHFRGIFVDITVDESRASAKARYARDALTDMGGRFIATSVTGNRASSKGSKSKNRDTMDTLVANDWFTDWQVINNDGISQGHPAGVVTNSGTGTGTAADRWTGDLAAPVAA